MTRDELLTRLRSLRPALQAEGVSHLALFGSRARNDHRPESDVDLLVEIEPDAKFSLLNLVGVEHIVGDATGLPANAMMRRSLKERFANAIRDDIVQVF
jgi:predicted nucleotidyltransferase